VFVKNSRLTRFTKINLPGTDIFGIFKLIITKSKIANKLVYKVCLMAKSGSRITVSLHLSLSNMVVVIGTNRQLKSMLNIMQTYKGSLISINMGITWKHRVHETQLPNTSLARENFLMLNLRTIRELP
jgi:hypothetical protein